MKAEDKEASGGMIGRQAEAGGTAGGSALANQDRGTNLR